MSSPVSYKVGKKNHAYIYIYIIYWSQKAVLIIRTILYIPLKHANCEWQTVEFDKLFWIATAGEKDRQTELESEIVCKNVKACMCVSACRCRHYKCLDIQQLQKQPIASSNHGHKSYPVKEYCMMLQTLHVHIRKLYSSDYAHIVYDLPWMIYILNQFTRTASLVYMKEIYCMSGYHFKGRSLVHSDSDSSEYWCTAIGTMPYRWCHFYPGYWSVHAKPNTSYCLLHREIIQSHGPSVVHLHTYIYRLYSSAFYQTCMQ